MVANIAVCDKVLKMPLQIFFLYKIKPETSQIYVIFFLFSVNLFSHFCQNREKTDSVGSARRQLSDY